LNCGLSKLEGGSGVNPAFFISGGIVQAMKGINANNSVISSRCLRGACEHASSQALEHGSGMSAPQIWRGILMSSPEAFHRAEYVIRGEMGLDLNLHGQNIRIG
jgi:hypothetical protein